MNPLKSRSTVVSCFCFVTIMAVNGMAVFAGIFGAEFALVSIYLCRDVLKDLLSHQEKTDEIANTQTASLTTPDGSGASTATITNP